MRRLLPHPIRRAAGLALAALIACAVGFPSMTPAIAGMGGIGGKGAANSFPDLVAQSPIVALVVVKEAPPEAAAWTVEVQRAYRGTSEGMVMIPPGPSDADLQVADRVLLFTFSMESLDMSSLIARFAVDPEGRILAPDDIVDTPATIADLDAFFGPPVTEMPAGAATHDEPRTRDQVIRDALPLISLAYVLGVLGIGLLAADVARRYLIRAR
jgi:hypothetical protein